MKQNNWQMKIFKLTTMMNILPNCRHNNSDIVLKLDLQSVSEMQHSRSQVWQSNYTFCKIKQGKQEVLLKVILTYNEEIGHMVSIPYKKPLQPADTGWSHLQQLPGWEIHFWTSCISWQPPEVSDANHWKIIEREKWELGSLLPKSSSLIALKLSAANYLLKRNRSKARAVSREVSK